MNTKYVLTTLFFFPLLLIQWNPSENQSEQNHIHETCRALADLRIEDTNLLSAAVVPADDELPEYCRVLGYVRPAINFEIRLPTSGWNNKFYMSGCGGWCGSLASDLPGSMNAINFALRRNYAVSTDDSGHWGEHVFDARWAFHNRQAEIDYGYRSVGETARVTKAIIEAYYEQQPAKSYFGGCSNGGRQAVMAALRYPDAFDGLISGCPHPKVTGTVLLGAWITQVNTGPDGQNLIGPPEAELVREAVYSACDALDGIEDGIISDPRACTFDPAVLQCAQDETDTCLTADQVEALRKLYDGPRDSAGRSLYAGLPLGSEPFWEFWVTGETGGGGAMRLAAEQFLRYMGFEEDPGDQYEIADFDFDLDPARLEFMAQIYDADDPDLDAFRENGGKLLMWHSWADAAPPPLETIRYYEAVEAHVGSREQTQNFFRLFMVPGMEHCGFSEGPGIDQHGFDLLTVLERWVEQGEEPASIFTTKMDEEGNILWTRPICPWPQQEVYRGEGDVNDASNFECVDP